MKTSLVFDPLLPIWLIASLTVLLVIAAGLGRWRGLKGSLLRILAAFILALALLNPQKLQEERHPLSDIVLLVRDDSDSMRIGDRTNKAKIISEDIKQKLKQIGDFEIVEASIKPDTGGTLLGRTLIDELGQLPENRVAGIIAITDGNIHDIKPTSTPILPKSIPFHAIIVGEKSPRDRRITPMLTPRYGMVGETTRFEIKIEDPGHEGETAKLEIRLNGEILAHFNGRIGQKITIPVRIEKRGTNTIEIRVQQASNELSVFNNVFVSEISGVRDRLRVLLVTGEPHMGGRAWRNLLKSDPSVDLVQFTILTNPGIKNTFASHRELSLIHFPARELFEEKLDEFDLVIFDQFKQRTLSGGGRSRPMLSPYYIANIAKYVDNGGALLIASGPNFASNESLAKSALIAVLPAKPTGKMSEQAFRPKLSEKGRRHPITDIFKGETEAKWGRWYRSIDAEVLKGDILMVDAANQPLLIVDKVKKGRVALLLSDQAWLWAKNHDNGGPYNELFRRLSHWLMSEPDLEADRLQAKIENGRLSINHYSLNDETKPIQVLKPDGKPILVKLKRVAPGHFAGALDVTQEGAYRIDNGALSTIAAAGSLNPTEFKQIIATPKYLEPLVKKTGGFLQINNGTNDVPTFKKIQPNTKIKKRNYAGLISHNAYKVTASKQTALSPTWVFFLLILAALLLAWRFEGR